MLMLLVLSDANKRFLYDVGVYNSDDDDDKDVSSNYATAHFILPQLLFISRICSLT